MIHTIRKMSHNGDDNIATWDSETVSPERLEEIETEFKALMKRGYIPADITDGKNEIVQEFDKDSDYLMLPRMQGGRN